VDQLHPSALKLRASLREIESAEIMETGRFDFENAK